ncbi:MAG: 50S ribosomal protein L20 [Tenericutes bacterium ADurb.Bin087]|nr:MAG: 50S ribosomal protein L20 [Tenericutes bacterium ADurb.Bin087]
MARVKSSPVTRARRKKVLKQAKGYFGSKSLLFKTAKEQVMHSLRYAYIDRRRIKRDYRKLWIKRINAGCRMCEISYSQFMHGLKLANVDINRKMLSELAINDFETFKGLTETAKKALAK